MVEEQHLQNEIFSRTEKESRVESLPSPMERRPTLPVNEVLEAERRERSWDNAAVPGGWSQPSITDRGRGVGDLGMAGLNIGAPARLQRGAVHSRRPVPVHRWEGFQGSCFVRTPALQ